MKVFTSILLIVALSGCSAMDAFKLLTPDSSGIKANAQIGKTNQIDESLLKVNTGEGPQTADAIVNNKQSSTVAEQITNTNIPMSFMLIFGFACWVSPSPQRVGRNLTNFILMLFGKGNLPKE